MKIQQAGDTKQLMTDSYIFFLRNIHISFLHFFYSDWIDRYIDIFQVLRISHSQFFDKIQNFQFKKKEKKQVTGSTSRTLESMT